MCHKTKPNQDENKPIFITGHSKQEERLCCKNFEQTQASSPTEHVLLFRR